MDDRAEFEQWAAERYEGQFRRNLDGDYCNVRLCEGWETWQAATARQRERDLMIGLAEIATSTGPTGGWLDSPKGVAAGFTEAIRRQP